MIRILLVDDNSILTKALTQAIPWEQHGIEVAGTALNGKAACKLMSEDIDILVTDVRMPKMDGIELAYFVCEHFPKTRIIFISAYSEFEYAVSALKLNVFDYITKPVDNDKLLKTVLCAYQKNREEVETQELVDLSLPFLRESVLRCLLKQDRKCSQDVVSKAFSAWNSQTWFTCIVFDVDAENTPLGIWSIRSLLDNAYNEGLPVAINDHTIAVVFPTISEPDEKEYNIWLRQAKQIMRNNAQRLGRITAGISQSLQGAESLGILYLQATQALGMRFLLGRDAVYAYPMAPDCQVQSVEPITSVLRTAENLCRIMDEDQLEAHLDAVSTELSQIMQRTPFIITAYCLLSQYIQGIVAEADDTEVVYEMSRSIYNKVATGTQTEVIDEICGFFRQMRSYRLLFMRNRNRQVIDQIFAVIDQKCFDSDYSLTQIADAIHLTPSYISMLFKQETGQNISQYINRKRIDKACDLLRNSELKIYQICEKIGLSNQYYFSVWFKKNVGYTPSEYRNNK